MAVFFTSDLHFGHTNAVNFDNRPFDSVEEMTEELIRRWNEKVKPGDLVYVLGDFIWKMQDGEVHDLLKRLNGQIILIKGNHDRFIKNAKTKKLLAGIKEQDDICVELKDGTKRRVIISHFFMPFYLGSRYNGIHLYGHFHNSQEHYDALEVIEMLQKKGYHIEAFNVGCMHWDYAPVTLDEILERGYNYPTQPVTEIQITEN
jgi:calcineurin-like phosphoesterase family protein